jgi:hypothetical protein
MSIGVSCPKANNNITVHVQGSQQTICVCGTYVESSARPQTLLKRLAAAFETLLCWLQQVFKRQPTPHPPLAAQTIRVRILFGNVTTAPSSAPQPGDCNISPPTATWCANPVLLPTGSGAGTQYTVFAWLLASDGSIVDGPHSVPFNAGGSGAIDCCASCGSGSGSARPLLANELAAHRHLEVAVPDGLNAGLHRATAVSSLAWEVTIRGLTYKLSCDTLAALVVLVVRGPASSAASTSVERNPFSAIFPGAPFGAAGDVVVTKA